MSDALPFPSLPTEMAEAACTLSLSPLSMPVAGGCMLGAFLLLIPHAVMRRRYPPTNADMARPIGLMLGGALLGMVLAHADIRVTRESGQWLLRLLTNEAFLFMVGATPVLMVMMKVTEELHEIGTARTAAMPPAPEVHS